MPPRGTLMLRRFIDFSQKTDFSFTWKIGGTPGPAQVEVTKNNVPEIIIGLEPKDGLPPAQARMLLFRSFDGLPAIKPDTWYRSSLQIVYGINGKIRISLFGKEDDGEILLKEWEYPVSEETRNTLLHTKVMLQVKGNPTTLNEPWIVCSEALIRQEPENKK
jgi:hypothetical protein